MAEKVNELCSQITKKKLTREDSRLKLFNVSDYLLSQVDLICNQEIKDAYCSFLEQSKMFVENLHPDNHTECLQAFDGVVSLINPIGHNLLEEANLTRQVFSFMAAWDRSGFPDSETVKDAYSTVASLFWNFFLKAETESSMKERDDSLEKNMDKHLAELQEGQRLHVMGGTFHFMPLKLLTLKVSIPPSYRVFSSHPKTVIVLPLSLYVSSKNLDDSKSVQPLEDFELCLVAPEE
jgi:hypothetical protein